MREILFRAKETFNGKWVEGYYEFGYDAETEEPAHYMWVLNHTEKYGDMFMVIPETVAQYTGLTDKNGKKIFDGDILVFCKGATHPIKVYWDGLGWKFLRNGKNIEDAFECNTIDHIRFCEIIGNIHDNPELLSKGA